jgi:hypothetical protein
MMEMTPAARQRLDDYLQRMRSELRGAPSADDVEQSVREHIEIALSGAQRPIGTSEVIGVLDRLGPPERWLAGESQATWRGLREQLLNGSNGWLLAYIAFGLFVVSFVFFPAGGFFLLIPAMVVSRAYVELARERGERLGARRWLVYPSIAVVLAFAVGLFIVGPPLRVMEVLGSRDLALDPIVDVPANKAAPMRVAVGTGAVVFGSWWVVAGVFCAAFVRPIRFIFAPLLDGLWRKHFAVLAFIGALVAAGGGALIYFRH